MNFEQAKDVYESLKRNEHIVENIDKEFFFKFAKTVLNELETLKLEIELSNKLIVRKNARLNEYAKDIAERDKIIEKKDKVIDMAISYLQKEHIENQDNLTEFLCKKIKGLEDSWDCNDMNCNDCIKKYLIDKVEGKR